MKRKQIVILGSIVLILCTAACALVGRATAKSYLDNVELKDYLSNPELKIGYFGKGYDKDTSRDFIDPETINSVEDLASNNTVIVKAELNSTYQRKLYYECVLSEINIITVYQGSVKEGDSLSIFEPANCTLKNQLLCTDGYSMMQEGQEYILFLKPMKNTYFGKSKYVYTPTTTTFSKYPVNNAKPKLLTQEELEEPSHMYNYNEIKDTEIYLYDSISYNKYIAIKQQVSEKYN